MTSTPLFDAHGILIPAVADGYMANDDILTAINSIKDVPKAEHHDLFQALLPHWNHVHFAGGGDHLILGMTQAGRMVIGFVTPWGGDSSFL